MIRAVLFDLFDTLLYLNGAALAEVRRAMAVHAGVDPDAWGQLWRENVLDRMLGRLGGLEDELRTMLRQAGADASPALLRELAEREIDGWVSAVTLYPETLPTLAALQDRGYALGLLSNCSAHGDLLERIGLAPYLSAVVRSCEVGVMKPDPAIYQQAVEALGVPVAETMFVADGAFAELDAAQQLGMLAVKIEQPHQSGDYGTSTGFDHQIRRLTEVLALLDTEVLALLDTTAASPHTPGPTDA
ncbi:MAG: HAD family hydrolase [Chloroflexi bacterium]|nr:HAD family hydrolase [Chloroflexota bacterium]